MNPEIVHERLASMARDLESEPTPADTFQHVVDAAVSLVKPCEAAGISLARRRRQVQSSAATDHVPVRSDELQQETGEGPCMDAIWEQQLVSAPDLAAEDRWRVWAPRAVEELGVRSMLCLRLFTHRDRVGALNLFSSRRRAFEPDDVDVAVSLAAHAAVAVVAARQVENMTAALDNRTTIGQATGILMATYEVSSDRAFEVLKRLSSHENRKLADIAADLVRAHDTSPSSPRRP